MAKKKSRPKQRARKPSPPVFTEGPRRRLRPSPPDRCAFVCIMCRWKGMLQFEPDEIKALGGDIRRYSGPCPGDDCDFMTLVPDEAHWAYRQMVEETMMKKIPGKPAEPMARNGRGGSLFSASAQKDHTIEVQQRALAAIEKERDAFRTERNDLRALHAAEQKENVRLKSVEQELRASLERLREERNKAETEKAQLARDNGRLKRVVRALRDAFIAATEEDAPGLPFR